LEESKVKVGKKGIRALDPVFNPGVIRHLNDFGTFLTKSNISGHFGTPSFFRLSAFIWGAVEQFRNNLGAA
jgi:hypothetical protein